MPIHISQGRIRNLSKDAQKFLCRCSTKCENYIYIEGAGRFCEDQALRLIDRINHSLELLNKDNSFNLWTDDEEAIIIEWVENGLEHGDIKRLSEELGRSHNATRLKISRMREKGII